MRGETPQGRKGRRRSENNFYRFYVLPQRLRTRGILVSIVCFKEVLPDSEVCCFLQY
jgi:hypothetical protein